MISRVHRDFKILKTRTGNPRRGTGYEFNEIVPSFITNLHPPQNNDILQHSRPIFNNFPLKRTTKQLTIK
jgi:hypothetical protein